MTAPAPIIQPGPQSPSAETGNPPPDGTGRYEASPLRLLRVPMTSIEEALPIIDRNFAEIARYVRALGGGSIGLSSMAQQFGWGHFKGQVLMASDTRFTHNMGRIPEKIVHVVDLDGQGRMVLGKADGSGPNTTAWTATELYVRASADGNFEFMVI